MAKINFYVSITNIDTGEGRRVLTPDATLGKAVQHFEKSMPSWAGRTKAEPWLTAPDPLSNNECHRITTISQLPKGCYFRLVSQTTLKVNKCVYVRDDYDKSTRRYCAYRFDDVNAYRDFEPTRLVCIDFTF